MGHSVVFGAEPRNLGRRATRTRRALSPRTTTRPAKRALDHLMTAHRSRIKHLLPGPRCPKHSSSHGTFTLGFFLYSRAAFSLVQFEFGWHLVVTQFTFAEVEFEYNNTSIKIHG
ncbi:hypothetical protein CYLTODRAFT_143349 [Cylindrobasidium torrendii FP15055 ss-10]|uniref:Uncharacterized protein n=1 Tax=Cylindrobasidium torrendii FP15055 ss-10 TaxID=1314674 RepID=A0A0D7BKU7_9AGAR|nr:hypothetical protein CYLTODRAFT_143349 [Cylindrobasidium torrendii FP15055 ss-10]